MASSYFSIKKIDKQLISVFFTGSAGIFVKAISLLLQVISIPLLIKYLGKEEYGILLTFLSFTLFLNVGDLGVGIYLQNELPKLLIENNLLKIKKMVIASYYSTILVSFSLIAFFLMLIYWVDIFEIFDVKKKESNKWVPIITIVGFLLTIPLNLSAKIYIVLLKGYIAEVFNALSYLFLLLLLFLYLKKGTSSNLVALYFQFPPIVCGVLSTLYLIIRYKDFFSNVNIYELDNIFEIVAKSIKYLLIPFSVILISAPDVILIAKLIDTESVVDYNILLRVTYLFTFPVIVFIYPLTPILNNSLVSKDYNYINSVLKKTLLSITIIYSTIVVFIYFFGNKLIYLWLGNKINISFTLWIVLILYIGYILYNSLFSIIANTYVHIHFFIRTYYKAALFSILLKLTTLHFYPSIISVLLSTIFSIFIFFFIPFSIILRRYINYKV